MLEGKAIVGETDMLQTMQQDALNLAAKALDSFDVNEATDIARFIKKVQTQLCKCFKTRAYTQEYAIVTINIMKSIDGML